jgi:hypothetical protein
VNAFIAEGGGHLQNLIYYYVFMILGYSLTNRIYFKERVD